MANKLKIDKDSLTRILSMIEAINEADEVIVEDKGETLFKLKRDIKDDRGNYVADNFFRLKCLLSDKQRPMKQHIKFDSINLDVDFKRNFL